MTWIRLSNMKSSKTINIYTGVFSLVKKKKVLLMINFVTFKDNTWQRTRVPVIYIILPHTCSFSVSKILIPPHVDRKPWKPMSTKASRTILIVKSSLIKLSVFINIMKYELKTTSRGQKTMKTNRQQKQSALF